MSWWRIALAMVAFHLEASSCFPKLQSHRTEQDVAQPLLPIRTASTGNSRLLGQRATNTEEGVVCIVTMVHDEVSRTLAEAQTRRMSHIFSDATSWVHRTFACNQTCQEGWELLPQKTYTMLVESLTWQPPCRAVIKQDDDGFFCLNRLASHFDLRKLDRAYIGAVTRSEDAYLTSQDRTSKYFVDRDLSTEVRDGKLPLVMYMQGASYLIGRRVIEFVARQPVSELLTVPWEDWSLGAWTATAALRLLQGVPLNKECNGGASNDTVIFHHCKSDGSFAKLC